MHLKPKVTVSLLVYSDKVTNEEGLHNANVDRKLLNDIVSRQMKFFAHVIRKEEMENLVVEGKKSTKAEEGSLFAPPQYEKWGGGRKYVFAPPQ